MLTFKNKKILNILLIIFIISFFVFPFVQTTKAQSLIGWWYEYKDSLGVHHINGDVPYVSKNACDIAWEQNKLSSWTAVYHNPPSTEICFQSATKPAITPEICTWPLVLDTTTNTCVPITPTCTLPQVLDTTTNTCVTPTVDTKTKYTLLAPLPFMGLDGTDATIDTLYNKDTNPCPFGKYLNVLIKLFLGIAGVLAVVMIVWGGIQYMTSELASSKEEGKKSITNAILGLLLALGAWLILNTINPDLLNVCLNTLPKAEITVNEAPPTAADFNPNEQIPTGTVRSCTEGITKPPVNTTGGKFTVCNRIANNLKLMINKAWTQGYKISGWGFRSYETQKNLRIKNGCPDIYTSPPSKCRIPTAIPGTSMHESGLAIDFTCDGGTAIQTHDNRCFIWLQTNAVGFLRNLPSEPWHWSINGS